MGHLWDICGTSEKVSHCVPHLMGHVPQMSHKCPIRKINRGNRLRRLWDIFEDVPFYRCPIGLRCEDVFTTRVFDDLLCARTCR